MATKTSISGFFHENITEAHLRGMCLNWLVWGAPRAAEDQQFMSSNDIHRGTVCMSLLPSQSLVSLLVLS